MQPKDINKNRVYLLCERSNKSGSDEVSPIFYNKDKDTYLYMGRVQLEDSLYDDEHLRIFYLKDYLTKGLEIPSIKNRLVNTSDFVEHGKYICDLDKEIYEALLKADVLPKSINVLEKSRNHFRYGQLIIYSQLKLQDLDTFNTAFTNLFFIKLDKVEKSQSSLELTQVEKYACVLNKDFENAKICHIYKFGPNHHFSDKVNYMDLQKLKFLDYKEEDLVKGAYYVVNFEGQEYTYEELKDAHLDIYIPIDNPKSTIESYSFEQKWEKLATFSFKKPLFGFVDDPLPNSEIFPAN